MDEKTLRAVRVASEACDRSRYFVFRVRVRLDPGKDADHVAVALALNAAHGTRARLPWQEAILGPLVLDVSAVGDMHGIEFAIPLAISGGTLNLPQVLTTALLASEYGDTRFLWLDDIHIPPVALLDLPGPAFGADRLLERLGSRDDSPLLSAIVKPRYGGLLAPFSAAAALALKGGADGLVDDEILVDPDGEFGFRHRIRRLMDVVLEAQERTNRTKYYFANITAPLDKSIEYVGLAAAAGVNGVMANSFAMGYTAFQFLARHCHEAQLPLIDCAIGSALVTLPSGQSGISVVLLAKLARLMGADGYHTGSEGEHWYEATTLRAVIAGLTASMGHIRPSLPVIAGHVNVGNIWRKMSLFGKRSMVNSGSGIWSHPDGPESGARSLSLVLRDVSLDLPSKEAEGKLTGLYKKDKAVRHGVDKWGWSHKARTA